MEINLFFGYFVPMKKKLLIRFLLFIGFGFSQAALAQLNCVQQTAGTESMHVETVQLLDADGASLRFEVLVADEGFERAAGFQHICPEVIENTLILFRYKSEIVGRFHMNNVHAPLDIGFFNKDGVLISHFLMETYSSNQKKLYSPEGTFQYALEARPGFFLDNNLLGPSTRLLLD